jgi:autotransporter translocation and assembly factor TamB
MGIIRRVVRMSLIVAILIAGTTLASVIVSQTAWFKNRLRAYLEREANRYLNGQLSIQRLDGSLFFGIEMEDVGVSMDGTRVVAVKDLGLDYNAFQLIASGLAIDQIRVNKPVVHLRRADDGWSVARLIKKQEREAEREGPGVPLSIDRIEITDGSVIVDGPVDSAAVNVPNRFDQIDAMLSVRYEPVHYSLEISRLAFRASKPEIGLNALSGHLSVRGDDAYVESLALRTEESTLRVDGTVEGYLTTPHLAVQVSSDRLSLPEIAAVLPALHGVPLEPAFDLRLNGPLDRLRVGMAIDSSAGEANAALTADVLAPGQAVSGRIALRDVNLAPILKDRAWQSRITADIDADVAARDVRDLASAHGRISVHAPRLEAAGYRADTVRGAARLAGRRVTFDVTGGAYGAAAAARGRIVLAEGGGPPAYDVDGRVRNVNLDRMPRRLGAPPAATRINAAFRAQGTGRRSEGQATFEESTVAGARIAAGSHVGWSLAGGQLRYDADVQLSDVNVQRVGREFRIPPLASDRYASALNAHVLAQGRGIGLTSMSATAKGSFVGSKIFGGEVAGLTFDAAIAGGSASVQATGTFSALDPAAVAGRSGHRQLEGSVSGAFDLRASASGLASGVTLGNVAGTARVTLDPSTVGSLTIDRAAIDADYQAQLADVRRLEIAGRDLNVTGKGVLALGETGHSDFAFEVDTSLEEVGKLVGRPVSGLAKITGTLGGNRSQLQAAGQLIGSNVKYGENGALSVSAAYDVRIPDLSPASGVFKADADATFVTLAGQTINQLRGVAAFADQRLEFEGAARQPERMLSGTGAMTLHPDHQELHLQQLILNARGQRWQLAPGSESTIRYGGDALSVDGLMLVNGNQRIQAKGAFGRPGGALEVTMAGVELAGVDALLLRPPQLSGRIDASATVVGERDAPRIESTFQVSQGGFRDFKYDSLAGSIIYADRSIGIDARLQQNPEQWITAKGSIPAALVAGIDSPAAAAAPVDVSIESSRLDLGLIQGFTPAVTGVTGTLEANVRITGNAGDPQPAGAIAVADGAMTVEPTGVRYTNIAGRIDLEPDRVHIDQITVLDDQFSALSVTGDLAVSRREIGDVRLYVNAQDFEVVDNDLGSMRVEMALEASGNLLAPRVQGYLGVNTGEIDLDEVLALAGPSPYATEPIEYDYSTEGVTPRGGPAGALGMDVQVIVPNDLVVSSANLQTPGSPIGLGALTVTLGGDLRAMKEPGGRLRLTGSVNTVRGTYDFQGRRFEILRDGTVQFAGLEELNPTLDLRARRLIQGVETRVGVQGTLKAPQVVLSSNPPLDEADILSLIVFNQPVNQLGEGQQISLAQRAQALAAGAVANQISQSIAQAFNLDTFEINLAPEQGTAAEVTLGEQIGQNLYLRVEQAIGEQGTTNVVLEYELLDWLRLQTNVLQGSAIQQSPFQRAQGTGVDLIFLLSY